MFGCLMIIFDSIGYLLILQPGNGQVGRKLGTTRKTAEVPQSHGLVPTTGDINSVIQEETLLAILILKLMVTLGALEMVLYQEGLFMDIMVVPQLEHLQVTELEVIEKVIRNDKPYVLSVHIKFQIPIFDNKIRGMCYYIKLIS